MLAKPCQIGRIDDLGVLNAPPHVAFVRFRQFLDCANDFCVGGVPNRVHGRLEAVHRCPHHEVADFGAGEKLEPGLTRRIGIGFFQPSAAAAQSAIEIQLYAAQPKFVVIQPWAWMRPGDRDHVVDAGCISENPHRKPASVARTAVALPIVHSCAHVGYGGNT